MATWKHSGVTDGGVLCSSHGFPRSSQISVEGQVNKMIKYESAQGGVGHDSML